MASTLDNPGVRRSALKLGVDQYHRLCESGIVPERTELLGGIVVEKMGKSPLHTWTVSFLAEWLRKLITETQTVRVEQPLTLGDSEPEPDIAVVDGQLDDFRAAHPSSARLAIEIAISTEEVDRAKATIYAAAGVQEYWLVLPKLKQVVIHREVDASSERYAVTETIDTSLSWKTATMNCCDLFPKS